MWKSAKDSSTPVGVIRGKYWLLLAVLPRGIAIEYLHEILAYTCLGSPDPISMSFTPESFQKYWISENLPCGKFSE